MQRSCANVNSLYKRKRWINSGNSLVKFFLWDLILFPFFLLYSTLWLFFSGKRQVSADFRLSNSVYLPYDTDLKVSLFFLPYAVLWQCSFPFSLLSYLFSFDHVLPILFLSSSLNLLSLYNTVPAIPSYSVFFICLLTHCTISLPLLKTVYYIIHISPKWKKEREGGESFSAELIKKFQ